MSEYKFRYLDGKLQYGIQSSISILGSDGVLQFYGDIHWQDVPEEFSTQIRPSERSCEELKEPVQSEPKYTKADFYRLIGSCESLFAIDGHYLLREDELKQRLKDL